MGILAYGEDGLTYWALARRLEEILKKLKDKTPVSKCRIFYRPSFGRRGGEKSSQFGEFDFIIISEKCIYLGESKWGGSSELKNGFLGLRNEQKIRHLMFRFYVEQWFNGQYESWSDFRKAAEPNLENYGIKKPLAPKNSILAKNLQTILEVVRGYYNKTPEIQNVILFFQDGKNSKPPEKILEEFKLVIVDYSKDKLDNFIRI